MLTIVADEPTTLCLGILRRRLSTDTQQNATSATKRAMREKSTIEAGGRSGKDYTVRKGK